MVGLLVFRSSVQDLELTSTLLSPEACHPCLLHVSCPSLLFLS